MKKKIISILLIGLLCFSGCRIEWSYKTAVFNTNNEYFKAKVLVDDGASFIVQNEITGEIFYGISGTYGVTLTPIEVNKVTERGR